ncbi:MAG: hypothetical protein H5T66_06720 [Chloroflexi bacterium]|nr:hypothetical protein [Chloroflexota bacterium]
MRLQGILVGIAMGVCSLALAQTVRAGTLAQNAWLTPSPWVWLVPLGVTLVGLGLHHAEEVPHVAAALPMAWIWGLLGYAVCGFALQYGAVGMTSPDPALHELAVEWAPLRPLLGEGWGLAGAKGFLFPLRETTEAERTLFLQELPWVITAVLVPLTTLRGRLPGLLQAFVALWVAAVGYPLASYWVYSGGWLSRLGETLALGRGAVSTPHGVLYIVGGSAALAGLAAFRGKKNAPSKGGPPPELPAAHLPLYFLMGAVFIWIGWLGTQTERGTLSTMDMANALWAVGASLAGAALYGWLIQGEVETGLLGRSLVAALVAASQGLPYWDWRGALIVGGAVGLLLGPAIYFVEHILQLRDRAAAVSLYALSAVWGILALGLWGQGEVTGWWVAERAAEGMGQFLAQLVGCGAILFLAGFLPWCFLILLAQRYPQAARLAEAPTVPRNPRHSPLGTAWRIAVARLARLRPQKATPSEPPPPTEHQEHP